MVSVTDAYLDTYILGFMLLLNFFFLKNNMDKKEE